MIKLLSILLFLTATVEAGTHIMQGDVIDGSFVIRGTTDSINYNTLTVNSTEYTLPFGAGIKSEQYLYYTSPQTNPVLNPNYYLYGSTVPFSNNFTYSSSAGGYSKSTAGKGDVYIQLNPTNSGPSMQFYAGSANTSPLSINSTLNALSSPDGNTAFSLLNGYSSFISNGGNIGISGTVIISSNVTNIPGTIAFGSQNSGVQKRHAAIAVPNGTGTGMSIRISTYASISSDNASDPVERMSLDDNCAGGLSCYTHFTDPIDVKGTYNVSPSSFSNVGGLYVKYGINPSTITTASFNTTSTSVTVTGSGGLDVTSDILGGGSESVLFNYFATVGGLFFGVLNNFTSGISSDGAGGIFFQTNSIKQLTISAAGAVRVFGADATNTYSLQVSSQTSASSYFTVAVSTSGHILTQGPIPSISSCGSTPNGSVVGDDNQGVISIGGGVVTSCTLTFANTWGITPTCVITDNSTTIPGDISNISATAFTTSFSASLGGGTAWYKCGCSGASCR